MLVSITLLLTGSITSIQKGLQEELLAPISRFGYPEAQRRVESQYIPEASQSSILRDSKACPERAAVRKCVQRFGRPFKK